MENPAANSTAPSTPSYNWVAEPKQRGTFGIISLCFSTMIICTWSTLHFNIPTTRYTVTHRFFLQVSWMFIALLAPEVLLFLAINERIQAGILLKKLLRYHPHLMKPGMLYLMCFWIRERIEPEGRRYGPVERPSRPEVGIVHAYYAMMGGFAFYGSFDDDTQESRFEISMNPRCTVGVPNIDELMYIMKYFPHLINVITEDSILERAACSSMSKALLIIQVAGFCTNCASRLFLGLPLSLLEVFTAAHAFCTILTYFVWWSKPMNVATPTILLDKEAREVYALLKCSDDEYGRASEVARKWATGDASMPTGPHIPQKIVLAAGALQHLLPYPERPPASISSMVYNRDRVLAPGYISIKSPMVDLCIAVTMAISPIIYGLVHFLAWSDQFPTPLERRLWHASSFVVSCSGLVEVLVGLPTRWLEDRHILSSGFKRITASVCVIIIPLAHVLASGFLLLESVRQLFFLNDAAYQLPSWSKYWPHFS